MANYQFDQAEGLRRMLAGPRPRVVTFVSAAPAEDKTAMLVNLGASLTQSGRNVLLVDACLSCAGIATQLDAVRAASLMQVARQERTLEEAVQSMPQGFEVATLVRSPQRSFLDAMRSDLLLRNRLESTFDALAQQTDIVLVDADLDTDDNLPLSCLKDGEIVVQVINSPVAIQHAYTAIKKLHARLGRRPFGLIVSGASEKEAKLVCRNMSQTASRYLGVTLQALGSVPADEHLKRAAHLGRSVVDAYPLAGASVAFRQLAGRFVLSDMAAAG